MDLLNLAPTNDALPMTLTFPSGEPVTHDGKPVVFMVQSDESPAMRAFERAITDKRTKAAGRTGKFIPPADELEREMYERTATAITGWDNVFVGGEMLPYSHAAALDLIKRVPTIRNQINEFRNAEGNFQTAASGMN